MSAENGKFRSCLFGGFSRKDVIEYIKKLSKERNALQAREEKLLDRIEELEHELETVKEESASAIRAAADAAETARTTNEEILLHTRETVSSLEERYADIAGKVRSSAASMQAQYGIFQSGVSDLIQVLDDAQRDINTLKAETFGASGE